MSIASKYKKLLLGASLLVFLAFIFCLPSKLFKQATCTVLYDKEGQLLGARIASDGQWRFPHNEEVSEKFEKAFLSFEDKYFYRHPGVNPMAILRALYQNTKEKRLVSGGSTVTMQVAKMSRGYRARTIKQKIIEVILAFRLELRFSKKEILALHASNAPFGGNVVGLDAAAWRYFGHPAHDLSWAEAATLAILPNAPSLMNLDKNRRALIEKRNRLLARMHKEEILDDIDYELARAEPLPDKPYPIPQMARQLLNHFEKSGQKGQRIHSSIDAHLQKQTTDILQRHHSILSMAEVHNGAVLIAEVQTGKVLAYVGNTKDKQNAHGNMVDCIQAGRSSGSILKPFLYAAAQMDGQLLPHTLVEDVPLHINGFAPVNFDEQYDGAVPADKALSRSLNVPAVNMLEKYGLQKFYNKLQSLHLSTINKHPEHYGLSLILGGAETSLWDIAGAYASLGRSMVHYTKHEAKYDLSDFRSLTLFESATKPKARPSWNAPFDAGASYLTLKALLELRRPEQEQGWKSFQSGKRISWKTGTSFGHRDAWAIGMNKSYLVAVWIGNADGEGRPGLTGVSSAAPVLFDVFDLLPNSEWFEPPYNDLEYTITCAHSGHLAGPHCIEKDTILSHSNAERSAPCPYHKLIHLDQTESYMVSKSCCETPISRSWFVLPPKLAWYYKRKHANYAGLPPLKKGCTDQAIQNMDLIYPKHNTKIFMPRGFDGLQSEAVFEAAHNNPMATIHWHIDDQYHGKTQGMHKIELQADAGKHLLTLVDHEGETIHKMFEVLR